jgi:hypothetical protein
MMVSSNLIKGLEMISTNYCNYDVSGLHDTLMKDDDFIQDLNIISCECDISKYLNNKSLGFMKVVKTMMLLNKENEMKQEMNKVVNNPNILEQIKNLDKK